VTGTKGKSTVVILAGKVLNEKFSTSSNNKKCGWISSLSINDGKKEVMNPYHMTMPGWFFIQRTLRQMVKNGCEYALVEVTSEGVKQHRHRFINWAGAVFTNLAPEHIEAHGGFEGYRKEKEKLFAAAAQNPASFGVYNLDDENVEHFLKYDISEKYGYSRKEQNTNQKYQTKHNLQITSIQLENDNSEFEINNVKFKTKLLGEFNVYNCAAAVAIGQACGVPLEDAAKALAKIDSIPGRLEIINEGQDFTVVVDLAHTPDSFAKVFKLFVNLPHNRIISVFGSAGGGRDKWKRPELGKIASEHSDIVIICNEDPYDENPLNILNDIEKGFSQITNHKSQIPKYEKIPDRRQAIARALSLAQAGDMVLVLGKGTEQTYVEGNKKIHWDDREVVREELKKLKSR